MNAPPDNVRSRARLIVLYLPQYHPIPENDAWWGTGFTEWDLVKAARPLFRGHVQPRVPGELGYYDLRDPAAREAQAELAQAHGIEGFCYWHYWMGGGRQLLERPFNEVLASGKPDFPFCLGWANHPWVGVYFGAGGRLLMDQTYPGSDDHRAHFKWLRKAFDDPRYIRVDGKPLLIVHRPMDIPHTRQVTDLWRDLADRAGYPGLYLIGGSLRTRGCAALGFDAALASRHREVEQQVPRWPILRRTTAMLRRVQGRPAIYPYGVAKNYFQQNGAGETGQVPCIVPNWDTTPRLGRKAVVLQGVTPELFRQHVRDALDRTRSKPADERLVIIRSWNEWGEGNYLEPDTVNGRTYLEVLRDEVAGVLV